MKLFFTGHDYKYAAEQMLMTLFPGEKPEYPEEKPCGYSQRIELRLSRGDIYTTASCLYCDGGGAFRGRAAVRSI